MAAILALFAFLCMALYDWLALQLGAVFGALASAGVFLLLALIFAVCASASRSKTKKRANSNEPSALRPHQRDSSIRNYLKLDFRLAVQSAGNV